MFFFHLFRFDTVVFMYRPYLVFKFAIVLLKLVDESSMFIHHCLLMSVSCYLCVNCLDEPMIVAFQ